MVGDTRQIVRIDGISRVGDTQPGFGQCRKMPSTGLTYPAVGNDAGASHFVIFHMFGYAADIGSACRFDDAPANLVSGDLGNRVREQMDRWVHPLSTVIDCAVDGVLDPVHTPGYIDIDMDTVT